MGLGTFREISLIQARKKKVEARELNEHGIDPKEKRIGYSKPRKRIPNTPSRVCNRPMGNIDSARQLYSQKMRIGRRLG
ncbi:hypothetical protein GCM10009504_13950 [Pseudomonas laurentiana]|nr:hypothetical protein GCM10009504_13950 [Pseudomonas laurentiana]